jgi:hypothetical protein
MDAVKYFLAAAERHRRLGVKAVELPVKEQHLRLSIAMDNLAADIKAAYAAAGTRTDRSVEPWWRQPGFRRWRRPGRAASARPRQTRRDFGRSGPKPRCAVPPPTRTS